ncbi:unnamed protein product [Dibothriocephalus latus]|uniref:Uncharacterized protein n=1 Tax=Dibothriocephalus latus TaxID=60516 RepID=A0A3P6P270_DIBLA|nr:unnamed protein product [Dibothriocephalus latus]
MSIISLNLPPVLQSLSCTNLFSADGGLNRYRTHKTASDIPRAAIDVVFSYHPPPPTMATTHTCMPVFVALIPTQSTQIPNLRLPSSSLPLSACESPSGDSSEAGRNRFGTLKSFMNSGSASGSSPTTTSVVAAAGSAAAGADALSTHIIYSLVTVESCGFVRQHTVYPTVGTEQGVLTETNWSIVCGRQPQCSRRSKPVPPVLHALH